MDKSERRVLTRQYKQNPPDAGIYKITNSNNGKIFIGASLNIQARINRHQAMLKFGKEEITALQADCNNGDSTSIQFEIIDVLEPLEAPDYSPQEDLAALKELWCEKLQPYDAAGYNKRPKPASAKKPE